MKKKIKPVVKARVSEEQLLKIKAEAKALGISTEAYVRGCLGLQSPAYLKPTNPIKLLLQEGDFKITYEDVDIATTQLRANDFKVAKFPWEPRIYGPLLEAEDEQGWCEGNVLPITLSGPKLGGYKTLKFNDENLPPSDPSIGHNGGTVNSNSCEGLKDMTARPQDIPSISKSPVSKFKDKIFKRDKRKTKRTKIN